MCLANRGLETCHRCFLFASLTCFLPLLFHLPSFTVPHVSHAGIDPPPWTLPLVHPFSAADFHIFVETLTPLAPQYQPPWHLHPDALWAPSDNSFSWSPRLETWSDRRLPSYSLVRKPQAGLIGSLSLRHCPALLSFHKHFPPIAIFPPLSPSTLRPSSG